MKKTKSEMNDWLRPKYDRTDLGEITARGMVVGPDIRVVHSTRCLLTAQQAIRSHEPVAVLRLCGRGEENQQREGAQRYAYRFVSYRVHRDLSRC